jgi:hypothetical protein
VLSIFVENWPFEYSGLRVRTLDGHQIHIFEDTVLPSCKNIILMGGMKKIGKYSHQSNFDMGGH